MENDNDGSVSTKLKLIYIYLSFTMLTPSYPQFVATMGSAQTNKIYSLWIP